MAIVSPTQRDASPPGGKAAAAETLCQGAPADFVRRLERTASRLKNCRFAKPCRLPACPHCSKRLARIARGALHKQVTAAMFSRARHLHFVTFTSPDWCASEHRLCPEMTAFAEAFSELARNNSNISGTWLAVDLARAKPQAMHPERRWQWHLHGLVLSRQVRQPLATISELCRQHRAAAHFQQRIGPADTLDSGSWSSRQQLYELIRYCDKSLTQELGDALDTLSQQVALSSTSTQFASGELASAAGEEVLLRRVTELITAWQQVAADFFPRKPASISRLEADLASLAELLHEKRSAKRWQVSTLIEYLAEISQALHQDFLAATRLAVGRAARDFRRLGRIAPQPGLETELLAGGEILYLRGRRSSQLWPQIQELGRFWKASVYGENAGRLNSAKWLARFCEEVYQNQLGQLLLPG